MAKNISSNFQSPRLKHDSLLLAKLRRPHWANKPLLAGCDEVGRGALAGPVVAAVACIDRTRLRKLGIWANDVNDSKKLSPQKRVYLSNKLKKHLAAYAIAAANVEEIDRMNVLNASRLAIIRAFYCLRRSGMQPTLLLTDALAIDSLTFVVPQKAIVGGDRISWSVAAASILAKVARDAMMMMLERQNQNSKTKPMLYKQYGFANNKGYGVALHRMAIAKHGLCPWHRKKFTSGLAKPSPLPKKTNF